MPAPRFWRPPALVVVLVVAAAMYAWWRETSANDKMLGMLGAVAFAPTEFMFYMLTIEDAPTATVRLAVSTFPNRAGHTTLAQFMANVVVLPFLLPRLLAWTMPSGLLFAVSFPLFVWAVEVCEGFVLITVCGHNPAWFYYGRDALLWGTIKLGYFRHWLMAGLALAPIVPALWQWSNP